MSPRVPTDEEVEVVATAIGKAVEDQHKWAYGDLAYDAIVALDEYRREHDPDGRT